MGDSPNLFKLSTWQPSRFGITSEANRYGHPTVIYRTPSRLVEECEKAYDAGLLFAALELAVTIPDVCARIAESDYRKWCETYLQLVNDGEKCVEARQPIKTEEEVVASSRRLREGAFLLLPTFISSVSRWSILDLLRLMMVAREPNTAPSGQLVSVRKAMRTAS